VLLPRCYYNVIVVVAPLRCCDAAVLRCCNTAVLRRCGTAVLQRYCCSDGVAALRLKFLFFFLLDSFRRENESEKEKKERDSKPVSRLYWLA
jgi:hypothetical protein